MSVKGNVTVPEGTCSGIVLGEGFLDRDIKRKLSAGIQSA
jgi:hypothetical protein